MRFLILVSSIVLFVTDAYACRDPMLPFFDRPSYIDPEYKTPDYSGISYGQKTKFNLILQKYKADSCFKESDDTAARAASEEREPENFFRYNKAAGAFKEGNYDQALKEFTEIRKGPSIKEKSGDSIVSGGGYSWAKEAATYMVARCQLILAQQNWDGYSDPRKSVDQEMLHAADVSYQEYTKNYPHGMYAGSARNIRRKIFYLSGNQALLDEALKQEMLRIFPNAPRTRDGRNVAIVDEFKANFRGKVDTLNDSPMLVAYKFLGEEKADAEVTSLLETREKDFSTYPGLFLYLRALTLYQSGQYRELIEKIPEGEVSKDVLSLSTQILRARALGRIGKPDEAIEVLRKMHTISPEDAVELEIAYSKLDSDDPLWIFKNESAIKSEKILRNIAQFAFTDSVLEKAVDSEKISGEKKRYLMDELAKRYLLAQRFKSMKALLGKKYDGFFLPLKNSVSVLSRNSEDIKALGDVGEFLYQNHITPSGTPDADALYLSEEALMDLMPRCKACSKFKERTASYKPPIAFFQSVVKNAKKSGKKSESEAKALHYLVNCGRGGEFTRRCVWSAQPEESQGNSSKIAFIRLHKLYKNSHWAQKTPYYYQAFSIKKTQSGALTSISGH